MTDHSVMAQGGIEKIGLPGSFLKMTLPDGTKKIIEEDIPEHTKGRTIHLPHPDRPRTRCIEIAGRAWRRRTPYGTRRRKVQPKRVAHS